uniref:Uncharacterized protein n=1 Tax=Avena sativa TaxID=4498 RepID=A0ACD5ZQ93_AVESA
MIKKGEKEDTSARLSFAHLLRIKQSSQETTLQTRARRSSTSGGGGEEAGWRAMAFLFGALLGLVLGVAVVMAFARLENSRAEQRRELAATVSSFSKLTVQDLKTLIPPEFYPSWVSFTQKQKLYLTVVVLQNNDLNPIWNEHYEFVVEDSSTQHLTVKIYDDEGLQPSEIIGCARVELVGLQPGKVKDVWLELVKDLEIQRDKKPRGQVHLELLYYPFAKQEGVSNPFASQIQLTSLEKVLKTESNGFDVNQRKNVIVRGVLSVTVISAEDIPAMDVMGKADPFVVLYLKKGETKKKTRVVTETLNPIWNQIFDFVVEDALHDLLMVEVWDHDTFGKDYVGRCILTLTRAILEGEFQDTYVLQGAKSGKLNLHFKWTPQPIYRDRDRDQ